MGLNWSGGVRQCNVAATYATSLFLQDPVLLSGTSDVTGAYPGIITAVAGNANRISGVIVGFAPATDSDAIYFVGAAASLTRNAFVVMDPYVIFEIQSDSAAALAITTVGLNAVIIKTHSGSTTTGISGVELDSSSDAPDADASNQLLILGGVPRSDNDVTLVHAKWHVLINLHSYLSVGDGDGALGV
jgi:hypothetical protein